MPFGDYNPGTMLSDKPRQNDRAFYAQKCRNLKAALTVLEATLGGGEVAPPVRPRPMLQSFAASTAEAAEATHLEAMFNRIDAVWAAWVRGGPVTSRQRATVELHARMTLLAAVEQVTTAAKWTRVAGALARARLGRDQADGDRALLVDPIAKDALALLEGRPVPFWTINGVIAIGPWSVADLAAGTTIEAAGELRGLFAESGYPEFAARLTPEHARLLVGAWSRDPGRPSDGRMSDWNTIRFVVREIGLGSSKTLHKDWQAFRRRRDIKKA
jgi:hypothetical protein